jgi:hypothetical protein
MFVSKISIISLIAVLLSHSVDSFASQAPGSDDDVKNAAVVQKVTGNSEIQNIDVTSSFNFLSQPLNLITKNREDLTFVPQKRDKVLHHFNTLCMFYNISVGLFPDFFERMKPEDLGRSKFSQQEQFAFYHNVLLGVWTVILQEGMIRDNGSRDDFHFQVDAQSDAQNVFREFFYYACKYSRSSSDLDLSSHMPYAYFDCVNTCKLLNDDEIIKRHSVVAEVLKDHDNAHVRGLAYVLFYDASKRLEGDLIQNGKTDEKKRQFANFKQQSRNIWGTLPSRVKKMAILKYRHDRDMLQRNDAGKKNNVAKAKDNTTEGEILFKNAQGFLYEEDFSMAAIKAEVALFKINEAIKFATGPRRSELCTGFVQCVELFEQCQRENLRATFPPNLSEVDELALIYRWNNNEQDKIRLTYVVSTLDMVGEYKKALDRVQALCQILEKENQLDEKTRVWRIKIKALNGDLTELNEFIEENKSQTAKRNQKKREKHAAGALAAKQIAEDKAKEEAEKLASQAVVVVDKQKTTAPQDNTGYAFELAKPGEDVIRQKVVKQSAVEPKSAPAVVKLVEVVEEKPLVMKPLDPDTYDLVKKLLSDYTAVKKITRDKLIKLFSELKCTVDCVRGKGSHAVIKYIRDRNGKVVGCFPESDEAEAGEINNNNNEPERDITMTVPNFKAPMHNHLHITFRNMLKEMGYTLETIQCEKNKSIINNNNNVKSGKKKNK